MWPPAERDSSWAQDAGGSGGSSGAPPPRLPVLDEAALQASAELAELCRLQLALLTAALKLSLQASLSGSLLGSVSDSVDDDEGGLRQQLLLGGASLRASVYCRAPGSLQTGSLQLQLVSTSDGEGRGAAAAPQAAQQAQRFLFLGQDGAAGSSSIQDQEQWILEQPVIVLPDSGGLVLPLAHNGFLVGLLVVERCLDEDSLLGLSALDPAAAAARAAAAADARAAEAAGGRGRGGAQQAAAAGGGEEQAPGMPQPPACLLFRTGEVQLLKQTAGVLALACAMDMRAALERVGAAARQRQASALVQAAKKPLSVMRTLGTMLLPRLEPGEPDRDFAQGILEQGNRLQEVVSQLQAALHPGSAAGVVPPALQASSNGSRPGVLQRQALPGGGGSGVRHLPAAARPALPSSSIGSDYQWGADGSGATIDVSMDEQTPDAQPAKQPLFNGSSSMSNSSSSSIGGSRASADLLNVLLPLLASASNFAVVKGVSFVMAEHGGGGGAAAAGAQQQLALPAAEVAVGPGTLKRMLSQLIDGVIACAAQGDLVQASVVPQQWRDRPGVAFTLCCCYGLAHGGSSNGSSGGGSSNGAAAAAVALPRPPLQPEFAFLANTAREAGGWFDMQANATPDVVHLSSRAFTAALWLPTVTR